MKIDALRLAAFRRFATPVAIEDFAAGVNVLAGPNEMGKSTFFHALEAAFLVRHKVTGAVLDAMRPFAGGEPLVEADFTHDGIRWRIRKQFGRGSTAVLTDLTTGRVAARNAEAEDQLGQLIGRPGDLPGPLGLVWVRQQRTLIAPDPDIDPDSGKQKARGERSALQDAIGREVETVAGGEALDRVQRLTSEALDHYLTPTRTAPRRNGPLDLARRQREDTRSALDVSARAAAASDQRLQTIATIASELAALSAPENAKARHQSLARLEAEVGASVNRRVEFDLAREVLQARLSEAENAKQSLAAEHARVERLASMQRQHAAAEALEVAIASLAADINVDAATPQRVDQLSALERVRDLANAELGGEAARVDIEVTPAGAGKVRFGGEVIAGTLSRDVTDSASITIDGIATIRITAAGAERAAAARERRDQAGKQIGDELAAIGALTIEDARGLADARRWRVQDFDHARAKLSGIAPGGAAAIAAEMARLTAAIHTSADLVALEASLKSREAAAHVARDRFDSLQSSTLSDEAFRRLAAEADTTRQHEKSSAESIARLSMRVENLKSEQAGADEDGRAGQFAQLSGTLERHDAEVKRLEAEGKALLLLARTLDGIEAQARDALFEPVSRRVQPFLAEVFGAADLGFKDAFAIDGLTRDGQREDFAVLSDGTREQLSVLVRLGFAELLAVRGVPVPVVLDDPLVYSDDERLAKVFGVLEKVSVQAQVIVLTCRATAFQKLSGHRLSVTAWQPET